MFLVVAEEDAQIDLKTLHHRIGSGRLSFGSAELLGELLGVVPGAVTPFGAVNDTALRVSIVLDAALMLHTRLNFHPLENTATTRIAPADLVRLFDHTGHKPTIVALCGGNDVETLLESRPGLAT